jgi:hypothetical protein
VQSLPNRRREIVKPEVVTRRRHQKQQQQRSESEQFKGKLRHAVEVGVTRQQTRQRIDIAKRDNRYPYEIDGTTSKPSNKLPAKHLQRPPRLATAAIQVVPVR